MQACSLKLAGEPRLRWSYDRPMRRYDGIADEYAIFQKAHDDYYQIAQDALRRLLKPGSGPCLDVGCGGGRFLSVIADLGWRPVGVDESADQLRVARERLTGADLIRADATSLPFQDASIAAAISMFTHTDVDEFANVIAEWSESCAPDRRSCTSVTTHVSSDLCRRTPIPACRGSTRATGVAEGWIRQARTECPALVGVPASVPSYTCHSAASCLRSRA